MLPPMDAATELVARLEKDRKHSRRVIFWLIILVIALPVIGVFCAYLYDCAPPEDSDMRPHWTTVPLSENGLAQFQEWLEKHPIDRELPRSPETDMSQPTWNVDAARRLVAKYQPALDEFDKLAKTDPSKWRWKDLDHNCRVNADLGYVTRLQNCTTLTRQRARILMAEGKVNEL